MHAREQVVQLDCDIKPCRLLIWVDGLNQRQRCLRHFLNMFHRQCAPRGSALNYQLIASLFAVLFNTTIMASTDTLASSRLNSSAVGAAAADELDAKYSSQMTRRFQKMNGLAEDLSLVPLRIERIRQKRFTGLHFASYH